MYLRQVSAHLEIDTSLLSNIERGVRRFNRDQVIKIARLLKLDEQELLDIWLCDKIITLLDKEDCGKTALRKALKYITSLNEE